MEKKVASVFLDGLAMQHLRVIGPKAMIGPFQDINFFVGPNKVGRSTVLLFLATYLHPNQHGLDP